MVYVDFCKGPRGLWVGCVEYNNGHCFASGRTLDIMIAHIKTVVWKTWTISARSVMLASRQMEAGEFESRYLKFMAKKVAGKLWHAQKVITYKTITKPKAEVKIEQKPEAKPEVVKEVKEQKKDKTKYFYEMSNGILYVYEKKLVAKYEIEDTK